MLVAIHQPNFLPWLGYFYKMAQADVFVLYDDAQFTRGGYINRCSVKTRRGTEWVGVPVTTSGHNLQQIRDVGIVPGPWRRKIIGRLIENYRDAPYFENYIGKLEAVINQECSLLNDLNTRLLELVRSELQIDTPLRLSSQCSNSEAFSTERLIAICKELGANGYLSGSGGKNYQDEVLFSDAGIQLQYSDFAHPVYTQRGEEFAPGLSTVDALFNLGPEVCQMLGPNAPL